MRIQPYIISGLVLVLAETGQRPVDGSISVEQTAPGTKSPAAPVESFDGVNFLNTADKEATTYSTRIGAFRMPGCKGGR